MNKKYKILLVFIALIIIVWVIKISFFVSATVVTVVADVIDEVQEQQQVQEQSQQKIIALAPHIVEMLFDIGVGDNIVGTSEYADFPLQANSIARVGNYAHLKIEKILAFQPDLIIAWQTGSPSDDLQRLEQLGFKVVYSNPIHLTDIAKELRLFGKLTGSSKLAEQRARQYEQKLAALTQQYQEKLPVTVFYELWSKPLTTIAQRAWPAQHLEVCGANNLFKGLINEYPQINIEQVIVADPQLIIQPMSAGEPNPEAINWQQFPQVSAAKYKQLITPNSDILHRMSYRLLNELEKLCADIDASRHFYQRIEK